MPNCPRCRLPLNEDEYEGVGTLFCSQCWGHWMTNQAFKSVLDSDRYQFSRAEKKTVFQKWDEQKKQPDLDPIVYCPICRCHTTKRLFASDCPVKLDFCDEHGVWLDAAEIKQVQIYVDRKKG